MRIAIIGAGWYGCHIASELLSSGCDVRVFDARNEIFGGASGYTQNRLHLGFHYPRSAATRSQTISGYHRFKEVYSTLSEPVVNNLYAVADRGSILDAETYRQIIEASNLPFDCVSAANYGLVGTRTVFRVPEEVLCTKGAKRKFHQSLSKVLQLGTPVHRLEDCSEGVFVDGKRFDVALDCTWGALNGNIWPDLYFESCITLVYESSRDESIALTVVDGPFFSIYPYEDRTYTLTSVKYTPISQSRSYTEAKGVVDRQDEYAVQRIRSEMERQVLEFFPSFLERFTFVNSFFSIKTKIRSETDARLVTVRRIGRVIYVFSGKIDAIFLAADLVKRELCAFW